MSAEEALAQVAKEVSGCQKCALYHSRKKAVPGEGPANAEIMFIGEGPGFHENEQGRPFVGAAGQFLDELLAQAGLKRPDVWIGNVVKCRPPGNRDPLPDELAACNEYLERQIAAINPKIIITLGRYSMGKYYARRQDQFRPWTDAAGGRPLCDRHVPPGRGAAPGGVETGHPEGFWRAAEIARTGTNCTRIAPPRRRLLKNQRKTQSS